MCHSFEAEALDVRCCFKEQLESMMGFEEGGYICRADGEDNIGAAMATEEVQTPLANKENALSSTPSSRLYPEVRRANPEVA